MAAVIRAIARYFPSGTLSNEQLNISFPEWSVDKIADKTGIQNRYIAGETEFSSDLGLGAAKKLLDDQDLDVSAFDYLIFVTQSPDFALPTTACLVHDALGMKQSAGAIDLNMGCSGYVYGLGMAQALIASGQANHVLLVTSDTYTKYLNDGDKSVRTIFGDGATATWISETDQSGGIGKFTYGTEGAGSKHLIVPQGGLRDGVELAPRSNSLPRNLDPSNYNLFMDGAEIFNFTLRVAGPSLKQILTSNSLEMEDIDYFVFHQANAFMLEHLRKKLEIPADKFPVMMANWGNTVSSTIPMAIVEMRQQMKLSGKKRLLLMGFGVGLSWGGTVVNFDFD